MTRKRCAVLCALCVLLLSTTLQAATVTNVAFHEEGDRLVVLYDLTALGDRTVRLVGSMGGGERYDMEIQTVTGDVNTPVAPGGPRRIVWELTKDYPDGFGDGDVTLRLEIPDEVPRGDGFEIMERLEVCLERGAAASCEPEMVLLARADPEALFAYLEFPDASARVLVARVIGWLGNDAGVWPLLNMIDSEPLPLAEKMFKSWSKITMTYHKKPPEQGRWALDTLEGQGFEASEGTKRNLGKRPKYTKYSERWVDWRNERKPSYQQAKKVVTQGARSLGNLGDEEALWVLMDLCRTRHEDEILQAASVAVARIGGPEAMDFLAYVARNEPDMHRRKMVVRALAASNDGAVVEPLWELLYAPESVVWKEALAALERKPYALLHEQLKAGLSELEPERQALALEVLRGAVGKGYILSADVEELMGWVQHVTGTDPHHPANREPVLQGIGTARQSARHTAPASGYSSNSAPPPTLSVTKSKMPTAPLVVEAVSHRILP